MWQRQTKPLVYAILAGYLVFMVALVATCGSCAVREVRPTLRTPATASSSAVMIEVLCVKGDPFANGGRMEITAGHGSGVMLDSTHVLTAGHVIECSYLPDVHVVLASGKRLHVVIERQWRDHDLARLVLTGLDTFGEVKPPRIAALRAGGACVVTAYPERGVVCGLIDAHELPPRCDPSPGNHWCFDTHMKAIAHGGNSGSGIYDTDGALVAILTGGVFLPGTTLPTGDAFAAGLDELRDQVMP